MMAPTFYPYMTAKENLELVCKIKNINYSKVTEKLELVGLIDRKDSKFSTFSLGMKQRLAIASALLNDPEILILDEPTNGLDPQGIHQIRDIIRHIASQGTTILLASAIHGPSVPSAWMRARSTLRSKLWPLGPLPPPAI